MAESPSHMAIRTRLPAAASCTAGHGNRNADEPPDAKPEPTPRSSEQPPTSHGMVINAPAAALQAPRREYCPQSPELKFPSDPLPLVASDFHRNCSKCRRPCQIQTQTDGHSYQWTDFSRTPNRAFGFAMRCMAPKPARCMALRHQRCMAPI